MATRVTPCDEAGNPYSASNPMPSTATLATGDIEIGAVEIKNDSDDTRLKIGGGAIANAARVTIGTDDTVVGALTETAPATDTASSGLNGRLQRIAQRLTTLITGVVLAAGSAVIGKVNHNAGAAALTGFKIDTASSGDLTVVAATSAQSTKLYRLLLIAAGATTITFKDGAATLTGAITLSAGGSIVLDFDGEPWFTGTVNTAFIINNSAAVQISGRAYYILGA